MKPSLRSHPLTVDLVDSAYPLVRELRPDCSLDAWRHYAQRHVAPDPETHVTPGITVTTLKHGIRALASYRVELDVSGARCLEARDVVVLGRPFAETLARRALGGLLDVADRFDCVSLHVGLTQTTLWLAPIWSDPEGSLLRIPVTCFVPGPGGAPVPPQRPVRRGGRVVDFPANR